MPARAVPLAPLDGPRHGEALGSLAVLIDHIVKQAGPPGGLVPSANRPRQRRLQEELSRC